MDKNVNDFDFKILADFASNCEMWYGKDGVLKYVSPSCKRITGYSSKEFIHGEVTLEQIIIEEDIEKWINHSCALTFDTGEPLQFRIMTKSNQIRWIEHICQKVEIDGELFGRRSSNRDVTDDIIAKEKLRDSEARYRAMIEKASHALFLHDTDGNIIDVNRQTLQRYGYTREELLKMKVQDFDPNIADRGDREKFWLNLSEDKPLTFEGRHLLKDGTIIPVDISITVIKENGKRLIKALTFDISERKKVENDRKMQQEKLDCLIRVTSEYIWEINLNFEIIDISEGVFNMIGYQVDEVIGNAIYKFMDEDEAQRVGAIFTKAMSSGLKISRMETYLIHKDGHRVYCEADAAPIYDEVGCFKGYFGVCRDISLRKKFEHEREKLINELQDSLAHVKTLKSLIPICASCKKIRDDEGFWHQVEEYIQSHADVQFSHGLCPDCIKKLYPDLIDDDDL